MLLLRVCFYGYSLGLLLYGVLRLTTGETISVVQFLDLIMPLAAFPTLVLLPLMLLWRCWRAALSLLPTVIALVLLYGTMFVPRAAATVTPDLTVMTYNILGQNRLAAAVADNIRNSNADIVVLEEATQYMNRYMTPSVTDLYPYTSVHHYLPARLGLGIYSRYPLLVDDYSVYEPESSRARIQIEVKGTVITLYVVHLANPLFSDGGYDPQAHSTGITALLDMLANESGPLIVAGDFNMTDVSTDYARMTAHLTDSFRESGYGLGFSFPSWSPVRLARLDYIFHNDDFRSLGAQVIGSSGGSDHFPVRAELAFQPQSP